MQPTRLVTGRAKVRKEKVGLEKVKEKGKGSKGKGKEKEKAKEKAEVVVKVITTTTKTTPVTGSEITTTLGLSTEVARTAGTSGITTKSKQVKSQKEKTIQHCL